MRMHLLGMPVDVLTHDETIEIALGAMRGTAPHCRHVALNVAKLVEARRNAELDRDVRESDIVGIDGAGIALALRVCGHGAAGRVAGIDLFESLMAACAQEGFRPFLLGAKSDVVQDAARELRRRHSKLTFAGLQHGYFGPEEEKAIVGQINASGVHCLFVALPTPQKERFIQCYRDTLNVPFVMGVGGSFDVVAGRVKRAPRLVQAVGCEWLYRFVQEPRRLAKRYLRTNAIFAGLLLRMAIRRITAGRQDVGRQAR